MNAVTTYDFYTAQLMREAVKVMDEILEQDLPTDRIDLWNELDCLLDVILEPNNINRI